MEELQTILELWRDLETSGEQGVLATVVKTSGSVYRLPGARMLIATDGRKAGSISGGCLESDLVKKAHWLVRERARAFRRYDTGRDQDGVREFGLGCNGVVDVMLEPVGASAGTGLRRLLEESRLLRRTGLAATVIGTDGPSAVRLGARLIRLADGEVENELDCSNLEASVRQYARAVLSDGRPAWRRFQQSGYSAEVFFEVVGPPPQLAIFGTGHDAVPLASAARALGWNVKVMDARGDQAASRHFANSGAALVRQAVPELARDIEDGAMAMVMTHNYDLDRMLLRLLLRRRLGYLGVLGPRERTRQLLGEVWNGSTPPQFLHFPAGLDIGGDSPAAVALSIIAEMQAVLSARRGGMLRDRSGRIHRGAGRGIDGDSANSSSGDAAHSFMTA